MFSKNWRKALRIIHLKNLTAILLQSTLFLYCLEYPGDWLLLFFSFFFFCSVTTYVFVRVFVYLFCL